MKYLAILNAVLKDGSPDDIIAAELVESQEAGELFCCANKPDDGTQVDYTLHKLTDIIKNSPIA